MVAHEIGPRTPDEGTPRHAEEVVAEVIAHVSTVVVILAAAFLGAAL